MKQHALNWARRMVACMFCSVIAVSLLAVPARREWRTVTQADGTTIEVMVLGDEFYHYTINREGKQVREVNGMYEVVGEAPTAEVTKARRAKAVARRQRKDIGTTPNLAPKGVVILVNFSNKSMQSGHTQATFDELCNSTNCTVNSGYPSAGQYFADQSNGTYHPQFDVFGPVTLSRNVAYYGTDGEEEGDDQHATDAVVEGCRLANEQFNINWADYDSNNDGYVDFVYVIYAGKGQADGGTSETIWPHNWSVTSAISYGYCTYTSAQRTLGGKKIDNYAMSGELSGNSLSGIGTLCHEFGHVMGLPDLYDTNYKTNYEQKLTPNDWNIMDGGSYNGDGHCPPNYDPWEKEFFGWHTTINLGSEGQNVTLYANGTENYQAYQINSSGKYVSATTSGTRYYIENRQAQGWDEPLTGHGMLIWKVNFDATKWTNNEPNNTANNPYYTVVSASGTKIGWDGSTDNCPKNTFPGSAKVKSWSGVSGKPLLNITETNKVVTLTYIEEPVAPVDPFDLTWMADGQLWGTTSSTGKVVLPNTPEGCANGKEFVGWTATKDYESATTAPTFVQAGDAVEKATTYYAVYANKGEGGASAFDGTTGGKFKIYANVNGTKYYATATIDNNKLKSSSNETEAAEFTFEKINGGFTIQTGGKYLSNGTKTNVSLSTTAYTWSIENGTQGSWRVNSSTNAGRALAFRAGDYNVYGAYSTSNINGTEYFDLEIGGNGGSSYKDYSTVCGSVEPCVLTGISLNTDNVKKSFITGETFSAEGLVVTAQYSNCNSQTVTPTSVSTPDMSAAGEKTVTVSYTEEEVTKTAEYKITVNDPAMYTIRFFDNGEQIGEDQIVVEGQQPKVPANPTPACRMYTFAGWWTEVLAEDNTAAKAWVTDFTATQDQDYYAIFSKTVEGEGGTTAFDGNTGGTFKIYAQAGNTKYYATGTVDNNKLQSSTNEAEAVEFTFTKVENGFTIQTDGKYLSNGSKTNVSLSSTAYTWSVENGTQGTWRLNSSTNAGRALAFRAGDYNVFGAYATSNINGTEYFDLEISGSGKSSTTYYSSTEICNPTAVEQAVAQPTAIKAIRNGQMVIIRGNEIYSVTGTRIQ